jgi:SagB-type dehydrogenase family enzyme
VEPEPFKDYPGLEKTLLPRAISGPGETFSAVIADTRPEYQDTVFDLDRLARILLLTHALTGQARYGSEVFYFRSVPSAGALHPFELYVAARGVAGVDDGLYHHDVREQSLIRLRSGSYTREMAESLRIEKDAVPVLTFFLTSIFFRSSWKYRDRAYRYHLLDTGHLAENLALALKSEQLAFQVHYDFNDAAVNDLLSVDPEREGCLAVVLVSASGLPSPSGSGAQPQVAKSLAASSRVSSREVVYPAIREIHAASTKIIARREEIDMLSALGVSFQESVPVPRPEKWPEAMTYHETVMKRRSRRDFVPDKLSADYLGSLLRVLHCGAESKADSQPAGVDAVAVGLLAGSGAGLVPGFYLLDRRQPGLNRVVAKNSMTADMAHACLGQTWLANCALHFLFLSNLELLEKTWGPRGYRYAMLTAGRLGQRLYLAATSMRLGCCGIGAFYDREAASLLATNECTSLLYLVAAGPVRRQSTP